MASKNYNISDDEREESDFCSASSGGAMEPLVGTRTRAMRAGRGSHTNLPHSSRVSSMSEDAGDEEEEEDRQEILPPPNLRAPGRPPTTGEWEKKKKAMAYKKAYEEQQEELFVLDPARPPLPRTARTWTKIAQEDELVEEMRAAPSNDVAARLLEQAATLEKVAGTSKTLKGPYVRALREAATTVSAAATVFATRIGGAGTLEASEEMRALRQEVAVLRKENARMAQSVTDLETQLQESVFGRRFMGGCSRTPPRGMQRTPPQQIPQPAPRLMRSFGTSPMGEEKGTTPRKVSVGTSPIEDRGLMAPTLAAIRASSSLVGGGMEVDVMPSPPETSMSRGENGKQRGRREEGLSSSSFRRVERLEQAIAQIEQLYLRAITTPRTPHTPIPFAFPAPPMRGGTGKRER